MKQLIKKIQEWLLEDGRCAGCGKSLAEGVTERSGERMYIACKCSRLYVYDHETKVFERCESECSLPTQKGGFA